MYMGHCMGFKYEYYCIWIHGFLGISVVRVVLGRPCWAVEGKVTGTSRACRFSCCFHVQWNIYATYTDKYAVMHVGVATGSGRSGSHQRGRSSYVSWES